MSQPRLWELWIPGQCPPGKNAAKLQWNPKTGRMRPRPRRRKNRAGHYKPTTWERWFWSVQDQLYWRRLQYRILPVCAITRLVVHYWWGDERNRDEPGRMDALSALLEATMWAVDDKFLRQKWKYQGLCREAPGLWILAHAEEEAPEAEFNGVKGDVQPPTELLGMDPAKVTVWTPR